MKKLYTSAILFITCCLISFSCSKTNTTAGNNVNDGNDDNNHNGSPYEVTYSIGSMNAYVNQVTYTDSTGAAVSASDLSTFVLGDQKVSVLKKPFTATIAVQVNNTTSGTLSYNLVIAVGGEVKQTVFSSAPKLSVTTLTASYVVQ